MSHGDLYEDLRVALRVVHTQLARLKLRFDRFDPEFQKAIVQLQDHLTILIYPFAYKKAKSKPWSEGGFRDDDEVESLASAMAAVGMGRILSCSVSFVSLGIEEGELLWYWWMDVQKRRRNARQADARHADEAAARPDPASDEPVPLVWLRTLLRLSRRSWIYLALAEARDSGHKGRLSDRYLGRNPSGGSRQCRLVPLIGEWDLLESELIAAYRRGDDKPGDAVASFVKGLEDLPADADCGRILSDLIKAAGAGLHSNDYPTLAKALRWAAGRLGRIHAAQPGLVCEAMAQFLKETDHPETWLGRTDHLEALLTALLKDVRLEREPADVLKAFADQALPADPRIPVLHPVSGRKRREERRPEDHVSIEDRFALSFAQFGRDDPEADVIVQSGIGEPLDDLAGRLAGYLEGPDQLPRELFEETRVFLADWVERLEPPSETFDHLRTQLRNLWLEAECGEPGKSPEIVRESLKVVNSWASGSGSRPGSWSDLDASIRAVILRALLIALVMRVHKALQRIYLADKQFRNDSYDAANLIESVIGGDWGEPELEPGPAEVRERLEKKAADARVRVMAIAALSSGGFVTGDSTGNVCAWDLDASGLTLVASHRPRTSAKTVFALEVFPSGVVAAAHANGTVTLWHPRLDPVAEKVVTLDEPDGPVLALARLGDDRLVAGDRRGQVIVWEVGLLPGASSPPEEPSELIAAKRLHQDRLHPCPIRGLASLGTSLVFAGAECGNVLGWDLANGGSALAGYGDRGVYRLAASPPATLVSAGRDRRVRLRDVAGWLVGNYGEGDVVHKHRCSRSTGVIHSVNGRVLAGSGTDVIAIDLTRRSEDPIIGHEGLVTGIAPVGDRVYSTGLDGCLRASDNQTPVYQQDVSLRCLAVLEDAEAVAVGDDEGSVHVVDPATNDVRTAPCPPRPPKK